MKLKTTFAVLASGLVLAASQASATTLTFEDLAEGVTLSNQYAALGAIFTPNALASLLRAMQQPSLLDNTTTGTPSSTGRNTRSQLT